MKKLPLFIALVIAGPLAAATPESATVAASPPAPTTPAAPPSPVVPAPPKTLYTADSPYHHIKVEDRDWNDEEVNARVRILYFDDTMESRMKVTDPNSGQFEYAEYFQMAFLWNPDIKNVLMMGLGGGSTQKYFAHDHPEVTMETVEIDPEVAKVAQQYFNYTLSARQKLNVLDGRVFLSRSPQKYDAILMDAYTQGRYGASIPPHLVTKEFFDLVKSHLTPNGVLAYNVIQVLQGYNTNDIVGAMYHTMKQVFPQVYRFDAKTSLNTILIATMSKDPKDLAALRKSANDLLAAKRTFTPDFLARLDNFIPMAPPNYLQATVLTDDFAPVEGLTNAPMGAPKTVTPPAPSPAKN